MRVTLWITTATHLDTPSVLPAPGNFISMKARNKARHRLHRGSQMSKVQDLTLAGSKSPHGGAVRKVTPVRLSSVSNPRYPNRCRRQCPGLPFDQPNTLLGLQLVADILVFPQETPPFAKPLKQMENLALHYGLRTVRSRHGRRLGRAL
jgi:hypothetical protein